jgi:hypothetical protein
VCRITFVPPPPGPCGGKTTALARLSSYLRERGFEVVCCPEVYTILASNGMSTDFLSTEGIDTVIQNAVLDVQLSLEDGLERVLKVRQGALLWDRVVAGLRVLHSRHFFHLV